MESKSVKTETCPNCHKEFQMIEGFSVWCEHCDWNLVATEAEDEPKNSFLSLHLYLSRKHGKFLFESLKNSNPENLRPTMTAAKLIALGIAALVHLAAVVFFFLGFYLLIFYWNNLFALIGGIVCLALAWLARPRFPPVPHDIIPREKFPTLYKFVDSIAFELGTDPIGGIVINEEFNAAFGFAGRTRKQILYIGLPLWDTLSPSEKTALVAHELSHGINGDPFRGFFVGTAVISLLEWYDLIYPDELWDSGTGIEGIVLIPWNIFLMIISAPLWVLAYALINLLFTESQKAEYLADYFATKICGTQAMRNMLGKNRIGDQRYFAVLHRFTLRNLKTDLFEAVRRDIARLPVKETERIKRLDRLEKSRLDATHPPTYYRLQFLKNHPEIETDAVLSEKDSAAIDRELALIKNKIQRRAIDMYKAYLYY